MNIFRRPDYKSEATHLNQLKTDRPSLPASQREGGCPAVG